MELQVDLRCCRAVRASDDVELPVAERCPNRVQVLHRHPSPVLRHVGVVPFRSPSAPLVDEQDVVIVVQQGQLPSPANRVIRSGTTRPSGEIGDRVGPRGR